ncbi:MAG: 5-formyltetrahydrofolate cyclo-ligase [Treponemataceae bacterium]|nr:MAG: 5-formyltetrahydrofolate cyclo-ligase [Treponemataceae bacterium]
MSEKKVILRQEILRLLGQITRAEFAACGKKAADLLVAQSFYQDAQVVLSYVPFSHEADTGSINRHASENGKILLLPKIPKIIDTETTKTAQMEFAKDGQIVSIAELATHKNVVVIVPGLAFSLCGKRLGRGGGYYDRYLSRLQAQHASITLAGFCVSRQIVASHALVTERHDVAMDYIVNENGVSGINHRPHRPSPTD